MFLLQEHLITNNSLMYLDNFVWHPHWASILLGRRITCACNVLVPCPKMLDFNKCPQKCRITLIKHHQIILRIPYTVHTFTQ